MKGRKLFWGIFFILAAVFVLVSKLGVIPDIGLFSIIITVFMIWMFVEGVRHLNFYEILFPVAIVCIVYDDFLGITALTPWPVLGAALLGSIGLSMIFHEKKRNWCVNGNWGDKKSVSGSDSEQCNGEHIQCENNFGSAIRYINSDNFCNAHLENNFGALTVYFDNAVIQGPSAYVEIENNFGETNLYVPKEWKIENCLDRAFGSVSEKGRCEGTSNCTLYIRGEANFGSIVIFHV